MTDFGGGGAEEEVGEEAVTVGAHGDEVAVFFFDPFDDLVGGVAVGEFGVGRDAGGLEFGADCFEVGSIFGDFAADGVGAVGAGGPTVGDMEENETALSKFREIFYVLDDGAVGGSAVEGYEDGVVHIFFTNHRVPACSNREPQRLKPRFIFDLYRSAQALRHPKP